MPTGSSGWSATAPPLLVNGHQGPGFLPQQQLSLFGRQILWFENYDKLLERACECKRHLVHIVLDYRSSCVLADIKGLVERQANWYRLKDPALSERLVVRDPELVLRLIENEYLAEDRKRVLSVAERGALRAAIRSPEEPVPPYSRPGSLRRVFDHDVQDVVHLSGAAGAKHVFSPTHRRQARPRSESTGSPIFVTTPPD